MKLLFWLSLFVLAATAAIAQGNWRISASYTMPAGQTLRGYGRVATAVTEYRAGGDSIWVYRFRCQNPTLAATLVGKFLADLTLSDRTTAATVREAPATITASGAAFVGCVDGAEGRILCAENTKTLTAFLAANPALAAGAAAEAPYPAYLDRFDRYGWGVYGVGGFNDFHGWMKKQPLDPTEDVQFLIDHGFRFDGWLDPNEFDFGDGIQKNTEVEWMTRQATAAKQPFSFRVYGNAGGANWTQRRFPEYGEQPADFLMSGWHGPSLFYRAQPHFTWYDRDIQRYMAAQTMAMMRPYADNPMLMGWMHPQGELAHDEWFDMHDDYSPTAARSWRAYLQQHGVDLATASRMYGLQDQPYLDWAQVPVPEFATFEGLPQQLLSLEGAWSVKIENDGTAPADDAWYAKGMPERYQGIRENWGANPPADGWTSIRMPGSEAIYTTLRDSVTTSSWFRHSFTLTAAQKAAQRIYLYWYPITPAHLIGNRGKPVYNAAWVNGQKAGDVGDWGALDVTELLRAGDNTITLHLLGGRWNGRIYLSTVAPRIFPYLGDDMNRLWVLWKEWHVDSKHLAWRDILDGMRQVDSNRPIKFMAPIKFGTDRWTDLATQYGGFGHFTGEGMWFFPWYKRYGFLYDVPGSSETAGPANNLADQFDSFRRTFLAGLNAHDPVFLIQTYTRNPELRQFWVDHKPVLKQMGRYDLDATQQVLLYRSTKMDIGLVQHAPYPPVGAVEEVQSPWNWDIGRGTLQTIGQSYLYVDDGGLADGKMNGFSVMVDCGNEIIPAESMRCLEEWVKAGGTFVTLPFTGRSTVTKPDSWPVRALTGCTVGALRKPGKGTVIIAAGNTVFPALAGRAFPDAGYSKDWTGLEHNLLSVELKPGPGDAVLATFENGAPAIVRHALGKGAVIVLGSAFWRGSQDIRGLWWPEPLETAFFADLLKGIGFPDAPCTSDDRLVWPQPYRTNNGLDAVTTLVSWHDDVATDVRVTLRLPLKPSRLVCYGVDGVKALPFTWKDGVVTATVHMPAKEVKVLTADVFRPNEAVGHWWQYQQRMWHELAKPVIDFTPYTRGKWANPTLDLRNGAKLTLTAPADDAWTLPGFTDDAWSAATLGILNADGAKPNAPVWVRKRFTMPEAWLRDGGQTYLLSSAWSGPHYQGSARMLLNGKLLHDYRKSSYNEFDVSRLLQAGENVVAFAFKGDSAYQGFSGNVWLYHAVAPLQSMSLAGVWHGTANGKPATLELPGTGRMAAPTRSLFIPKEWEGRYQVRLYLVGNQYSILGASVNGRLVRRHHHNMGTRCDIDITRFLQFGAMNELVLAHAGDPRNGPEWNISLLRLDLYPAVTTDAP